MQKWPKTVSLIRHGKTVANLHKTEEAEGYEEFQQQFTVEYEKITPGIVARGLFPSPVLKEMALKILEKWAPDYSDYEVALTDEGMDQAVKTGQRLADKIALPQAIYVSPYKRTKQTLAGLAEGWPALGKVKTVEDDRVREKESGMHCVYGDPRLYNVFHPQYALLKELNTYYEYRAEDGESLLDVRARVRSFVEMVIREHGGMPETFKDVIIGKVNKYSQGGLLGSVLDKLKITPDTLPEDILVVTHSLTILAIKANLERWDKEEFLSQNKHNFPVNCGVTIYRGKASVSSGSRQGRNGRLTLDPSEYNIKLY